MHIIVKYLSFTKNKRYEKDIYFGLFIDFNKVCKCSTRGHTAVIVEDVFMPGYIQDVNTPHPSHSNAHSQGEIVINGVNSDLYSFTWDHGDGSEYGDGGMVVRQYAAGTTINSGTAPLYEDFISMGNGDFPNGYIRSLESGILREGGETYILLSYFKNTYISPAIIQNEYYLDLYSWGGVTGLTLISSTVLDDIGNEHFGWIHQDVNNLTDFVITWEKMEQTGLIKTIGGSISGGGVQLGGIGYLDHSNIELRKPDVAMMKDWDGAINLYYVYTDYSSSELFVAKAHYGDLINIAPGNVDPLNCDIINVVSNNTKFDLPRIDAPDNSMSNGHESWSFVVAEHTGTQDLILAHIFDGATGSINSQYLNDGTLVVCPPCDISPTGLYDPFVYNTRAVVAFSNNETDVYYGWCFGNPDWMINNAFPIADATYLSVKVDLDFNLLNFNPNQYFAIPSNNNTLISPSMAFSTQNDGSPYLFTTFFQWPNPFINYDFFIGLKTVDWSMNLNFKSEPTNIINTSKDNYNLQIFPNPFIESFSIELNRIDKNTAYELNIYDILGRLLYNDNGTIQDINKHLVTFGKNVSLGSYYLNLKNREMSFNKTLLKQYKEKHENFNIFNEPVIRSRHFI